MPVHTPRSLLEVLDNMGLEHVTIEHPALRTVEESKRLRGDLVGAHVKNLFLKARSKGRVTRYVLVVAIEDQKIDLKAMRRHLGFKGLSFASHEALDQVLGIKPGAVSPLALINAGDETVDLVLDAALRDRDWLNFHPLSNEMTTRISSQSFLFFLSELGIEPRWVELPL